MPDQARHDVFGTFYGSINSGQLQHATDKGYAMTDKKKIKEDRSLTLKVAEASSKDVGRGIIRFDPADFKKLGVEVGDIVVISGKRETAAKVMPAYMEDRGKGLIRLDGITRENAKTGIDEKVTVRKTDFSPAQKIVVAPLTLMRSHDARYIGSLLEGLPLMKGDTVRARLFGTKTQDFEVVSTSPGGVALISQNRHKYSGPKRSRGRSQGRQDFIRRHRRAWQRNKTYSRNDRASPEISPGL